MWPYAHAVPLASGASFPPPTERWGLGYQLNLPPAWVIRPFDFGPQTEAFGHGGHGGQMAFCDQVNRVAVSLLRSDLVSRGEDNRRVVEALYAAMG
jgi:CubicO group peptidase (beta-lactamase class C family)